MAQIPMVFGSLESPRGPAMAPCRAFGGGLRTVLSVEESQEMDLQI